MARRSQRIAAIDLFCGAGGLSAGLRAAGVDVVAGVDNDPACAYPFERNIEAPFIERDVREITAAHFEQLWPKRGHYRLLAGCAPCQPFSPYRRGIDTSSETQWPLLDEFARLIDEVKPHFVTMENVPRVRPTAVFERFVTLLESNGYHVDWRSCDLLQFGVPQQRRRVVLVASLLGAISVPEGLAGKAAGNTVRHAIGDLPPLKNGEVDPADALHVSRKLSPLNMDRIRASKPGGTWEDWPLELRAPCHKKDSGSSFKNVYARMSWDKPSPTITTLASNFGAGRFGHPEQDRSITLREAALIQGFPQAYQFVRPGGQVYFNTHGRLIGNAVPPPLAQAIGEQFRAHVGQVSSLGGGE